MVQTWPGQTDQGQVCTMGRVPCRGPGQTGARGQVRAARQATRRAGLANASEF